MEKSERLKQKIDELSEKQAKDLLIDLYTDLDASNEEWFEEHLNHQLQWHTKTVHIIFGRAASISLKQAVEEHVIAFPDVLAIGPITQLHTWKGMEARFHWCKDRLNDPYNEFKKIKRNMMQSIRDIKRLSEDQDVCIWMCPNAAEKIGASIIAAILPPVKSVTVIDTYQAYREVEQHDVPGFPRTTGELTPETLQQIANLSIDPVREEQLHLWGQQGQKWLDSESTLRILQGEEVVAVEEDYLDSFILDHIENTDEEGFIDAAVLLGEVYGTMVDYTGDTFLEYRMRQMIETGQLVAKGDLEDITLFKVKCMRETSLEDDTTLS